MEMILTVLRLIAFLLSSAGYVAAARVYLNITPKASYIFTFSSLALLMYFAGLAGVLPYAAYTLFGFGVALLAMLAARKKLTKAFNLSSLNAINLAFAVGCTAFIASLINTRFVHYDNFSHWALVTKYMLVTDHIPNAASAIIDFKSYPLGSSSFLYYVCRIVGNGEGVMLAGQAMLLFACFYAMFGVIRDHKRFLLAAVMGLGCSVLAYFNIGIRINNLLVDFLLPALSLAAVGVLISERKNCFCACLASLPVLGLITVVKNTGIVFAAMGYIVLINRAVRFQRADLKRRPQYLLALGTIVLSMLPFIFWSVHKAIAFPADVSKFSYDFHILSSFTFDKTPEQIHAIVRLFFQKMTALDQRNIYGVLIANGIALAAYLVARFVFHKKWKLLNILLLLDLGIVLHSFGILMMYIYIMPLDEALRLLGFERYVSSMVLFVIGALTMRLTMDLENSFYRQQGERRDYLAYSSLTAKSAYQIVTVAFTFIAALLLLSELNGMNSMKRAYAESLPAKVEAMVGDNWSQPDDNTRYLIYASDEEEQVSSYYLRYVARYFLFAAQVDAVSAFDDGTFLEQIQTYDKVVILESTPEIRDDMKTYAGLPGDPGVYDVHETFAEAVQP